MTSRSTLLALAMTSMSAGCGDDGAATTGPMTSGGGGHGAVSTTTGGASAGGGARADGGGGSGGEACPDDDDDGHASATCGGDDCDDGDPEVHPGARDLCGDGLDADCMGDDDTCIDLGFHFVDVTDAAQLFATHDWDDTGTTLFTFQVYSVAGGLACSDYDNDGFFDIYVVGCSLGQSALYHNQGDGTFADVSSQAGVDKGPGCDAGPIFADVDGDGLDDLFIGGVEGATPRLFMQRPDHGFDEATSGSGFDAIGNHVYGGSFADVDQDGDLDVMLARWATPGAQAEHLFRNDAGSFAPMDDFAGLGDLSPFSFTPNFVDMDEDGILDLVVSSDFHTSKMFWGSTGGRFLDAQSPVIDDDNGMGAAIGDYDGDGHFDWFLTSVWDPDGVPQKGWGVTGNRMYRNAGDGTLVDATDEAGVRVGYWAWGTCFADFDNDGDLDLFHVNGFDLSLASEFKMDPSRLFLNEGDGTFTERSHEVGIHDEGQGRAVACFDYDRDGDVDILVQQSRDRMRLFRNDLSLPNHYVAVAVRGPALNAHAVGARVEVVAGGTTRIGLVRAGSNYASQDPTELHFGLGEATTIDSIVVKLPGAAPETFGPFDADQRVELGLAGS